MNNTSRFIMGIYQVSIMIRDSLEYLQNRDNFDVKVYNQRKAYIEHGLVEEAPLAKFLANNGETGEKIKKNLNEFFDAVYGPESTIVSIDGDRLVVDKAQSIKLLDYIVGLHETLFDIEKGFIAQAKKDNVFEQDIEDLIKFDEKYFRAILCINLVDMIHAQFLEFNKAMRESNGQTGPQTNYILNEIKKLVGLLKFQSEHANKEDEDFAKAYDSTFTMLKYMEGSEKPQEGKSIRDQIIEARKLWEIEIGKNEPEWRTRYSKQWEDLVQYERELQNNK